MQERWHLHVLMPSLLKQRSHDRLLIGEWWRLRGGHTQPIPVWRDRWWLVWGKRCCQGLMRLRSFTWICLALPHSALMHDRSLKRCGLQAAKWITVQTGTGQTLQLRVLVLPAVHVLAYL